MSSSLLHFSPFRLDPSNERLWRETVEIPLRPKTFAVLRYLVEHPEQLVTKEELLNAVWAETVVGEDALTGCIRDLRKVLGDEAKQPQYIETVHRRGFRFIGKVVSSQPEEVRSEQLGVSSQLEEVGSLDEALRPSSGQAPRNPGEEESVSRIPLRSIRATGLQTLGTSVAPASSRFTRGVVLAAVLFLTGTVLTVLYLSRPTHSTQSSVLSTAAPQALPLPNKPSLIVLPLVNLSGDPEQEYFSDGLTEVLTGDLSKISSLFVIARNSAFTYKGKAVKVQDVSKEMGVRYVLEGSVQKANQRIRIAVQLIDATTGYHVLSERYDRPLTDIFTLQDEIVQKIVTTLKLQLTLEEQGYILRKNTDNLEAYDYFLRGVDYCWRFTPEADAQGRQLLEKAIALDPQYAEAYAVLGRTYSHEWFMHGSTDPQILARALALAQKAVALDDSLPAAHSILGGVYAVTQQYDQAIAEEERAIALDPNHADSYWILANALNLAGRHDAAVRAVKQAMQLNPHYPPNYLLDLGWAYCQTGRYAEAITTLQELISRSPNFMGAHLTLAVSYLLQWLAQQSPAGQTLEPAVGEMQQVQALNDSPHWWNHIVLGYLSLYQQQYDQALAEMKRGVALAPTLADGYASLAEVLSCMGRTKEALEAAVQALRLKSSVLDTYLDSIGIAYAVAGHYQEARPIFQRYLSRYPNMLYGHVWLAAVYSELGQDAEARGEAAEILRLNPHFSLEVQKQRMPTNDPAVVERTIAALRKAGLK